MTTAAISTYTPAQIAKARAAIAAGTITITAHTPAGPVYAIPGSGGAVYTTTSNGICDCHAGQYGRRCWHLAVVDLLGADTPRDHEISIDTAAAELAVRPATVARYLRSGRLVRLGQGVSADSVETYKASRTANIARTRQVPGWRRPAPTLTALPATSTPIEEAAALWAEAGRLEALARKLKERARPVLDEAGEGRHGAWHVAYTAGREVLDTKAVRADYAARGVDVPMRRNAPSIKVTPAA